MAAAFDSDPSRRSPLLSLRGLTLARPESTAPVLREVDLDVHPGECVLLRGATGSGKTTLLREIAGLGRTTRRSGEIESQGTPVLLLQSIETQLLCPSVAEEVALGLRSRALPSAALGAAIRDELARVGLAGFESRQVDTLSAGQKQRVVIAALLAMRPRILMLDEPFSALDEPSRRGLVEVLRAQKRAGTALLIAEHRCDELLPIVDRALRIVDGGLCPRRAARGPADHTHAAPRRARRDRSAEPPGQSIPRPRPTRAPEPATLAAIAGADRLLVTGPNGAGKSTLLRALAAARSDRERVALVIQDPRRSLCQRSVRAEIAFSLERQARDPGRAGGALLRDRRPTPRDEDAERERRVGQLLERFALRDFAARSPRRLSHGQQHRLAIAAALAPRPDLAILDEPFSGLDEDWRERLLAILAAEQTEAGTRFVLASHDLEPLADWCGERVELTGDACTSC